MKPPLFHVGQAVACTESGWITRTSTPVPQKGKIYTVAEVIHGYPWQKKWWQFWEKKLYFLVLVELPQNEHWLSEAFAPVEEMPAEAYAELLEALEPVTV